MLECVVNISEGRDLAVVDAIAAAAGRVPARRPRRPPSPPGRAHPGRPTPAGSRGARRRRRGRPRIDLRTPRRRPPPHRRGRRGALRPAGRRHAADAAGGPGPVRGMGRGDELGVPCFLYGPERTLPDVRRQAFTGLAPDTGPAVPIPPPAPSRVGARPVLVAYNVWLRRRRRRRRPGGWPRRLRGPAVRALGLAGRRPGPGVDEPDRPATGWARRRPTTGWPREAATVAGAELVGLLPRRRAGGRARRPAGPSSTSAPERTIEARLERGRGLTPPG